VDHDAAAPAGTPAVAAISCALVGKLVRFSALLNARRRLWLPPARV